MSVAEEYLRSLREGTIEDVLEMSEQRVLWNLEASLESTLVEPFKPEYGEILAAARSRVRDPIE